MPVQGSTYNPASTSPTHPREQQSGLLGADPARESASVDGGRADELWVIKIGGRILEDATNLKQALSTLSHSGRRFILVHGGGDQADRLAQALGLEQRKVNGRRITDADTLDVAVMSFAGLLNKQLVAQLQALGVNALGMTGADAGLIRSIRRPPVEVEGQRVDYGFVGEPIVQEIDAERLLGFLDAGLTPVLCSLTHDGDGQLLNTNADTLAASVAVALATTEARTSQSSIPVHAPVHVPVHLALLLDKAGLLRDADRPETLVEHLSPQSADVMIKDGTIRSGMIPKVQMALWAAGNGVGEVAIGHPSRIASILRREAGSATFVVSHP